MLHFDRSRKTYFGHEVYNLMDGLIQLHLSYGIYMALPRPTSQVGWSAETTLSVYMCRMLA